MCVLAIDEDAPVIGTLNAGEQTHERRLAGAVLPGKRADLARAQGDRDAPSGADRAV